MKNSIPERLYPGTEIWDKGIQEHIQRYEFASQECRGQRVLDAACGVGYGSAFLLNRGAASVLGVDISWEAVNIAKANYSRDRLDFRVDDCETFSAVTEKIDAIVALECIEHFRDPDKFLERCIELLPDDGVLILSTPNIELLNMAGPNRPANPFHVHEFTYSEFRQLLSKYFDDVSIHFQVKTPLLRLYEDLERFVQFEYKFNPFLRFGLWLRRRLNRPGPEPVIRPRTDDFQGYEIKSEIINPKCAWVFVAVCRKQKTIGN